MRVISEMDAGPTFAVASVPIPPDATSGEMEGTLARLGAHLLLPVVDDLAAGRAVETPQDHARATHAAKVTKSEGAIDWRQPAAAVHNQVRGLQPWPLASTRLAGERLVIRRTTLAPGVRSESEASGVTRSPAEDADPDLTPGTVVRADELVVACGAATTLGILELQPEGRRTMTAREFLAGRAAVAGARIEP